jgi:hypothetical protein
MPNTLLDH